MIVAVYAEKIKKERNGGKQGPSESNYRGTYTRIRIYIDTSKPILPGLFLGRINRKPVWVYMKYEKLPNVCYRCRKLNHERRQCKAPVSNKEKLFGGWLKVEDNLEYTSEWLEEMLG